MKVQELIRSHRYAEAIADLRRDLANNPEDLRAIELMAIALHKNGEYEEALSFFERLVDLDKVANPMAVRGDTSQINIACLHWLLDDHARSIQLMHGLVAGIIDGSIKYADAAGGMRQGLLLYYMAITDDVPEEASFAMDYMRNRVRRNIMKAWPCAVAQYLLGEVPFEIVMEAVNHQPNLVNPDAAKLELGRRRRLAVAVFHDGVRFRVQGDEEHCLVRMWECYGLNSMTDQEWYLARSEVQKADNG